MYLLQQWCRQPKSWHTTMTSLIVGSMTLRILQMTTSSAPPIWRHTFCNREQHLQGFFFFAIYLLFRFMAFEGKHLCFDCYSVIDKDRTIWIFMAACLTIWFSCDALSPFPAYNFFFAKWKFIHYIYPLFFTSLTGFGFRLIYHCERSKSVGDDNLTRWNHRDGYKSWPGRINKKKKREAKPNKSLSQNDTSITFE
jgi:hypothetical protein